MPSHTPSQSAWVMKPSSGVKPPMPSMMRSPFSRELTVSRGSLRARACSAASASPASARGSQRAPAVGSYQGHDLSSSRRSFAIAFPGRP